MEQINNDPLATAAEQYVDNHSDPDVRSMYGQNYRSFKAGAEWQRQQTNEKINSDPVTHTAMQALKSLYTQVVRAHVDGEGKVVGCPVCDAIREANAVLNSPAEPAFTKSEAIALFRDELKKFRIPVPGEQSLKGLTQDDFAMVGILARALSPKREKE